MYYDSNRALELLKLGTGNNNAIFRDSQDIAIQQIVTGGRLLVIQKTGWGKSFVYLKKLIGFHGVRKDFMLLLKEIKQIILRSNKKLNQLDTSIFGWKIFPVGRITKTKTIALGDIIENKILIPLQ